jgi:hypothetical protein
MSPHSETVCMLAAQEYKERLREAAKERVAASAQASKGSFITRPRSAGRIAAAWLSGLLTRWPRSNRARVSSPFASG